MLWWLGLCHGCGSKWAGGTCAEKTLSIWRTNDFTVHSQSGYGEDKRKDNEDKGKLKFASVMQQAANTHSPLKLLFTGIYV